MKLSCTQVTCSLAFQPLDLPCDADLDIRSMSVADISHVI